MGVLVGGRFLDRGMGVFLVDYRFAEVESCCVRRNGNFFVKV